MHMQWDKVRYEHLVAAVVGVITFLVTVRQWAKGGVCRANRDIRGKVVVVTGGNSGIGKPTVEELVKRGANVIFGARDKTKSAEVLKSIKNKHEGVQLTFFPLDLADKKSIEEFSQLVKGVTDHVDILINNAGLASSKYKQTKDGFQMTMGVNHLGHFYLTHLLWNLIKKANKPRVICVSSILQSGSGFIKKMDTIDFGDMRFEKNYSWDAAYARSKMANVLFARELQARMDEAGIEGYSYSLHPGSIPTDMGRDLTSLLPVIKVVMWPIFALLFKTPLEGAQTTLHLALQDESKLQKGEYYRDCKREQSSKFTSNMQNARQLWKISEQLLNITFNP